MSLQGDDSENLSPKAAAFSIANLLTKDINQNPKTTEFDSTLIGRKERENTWTRKHEDQMSNKLKLRTLSRETCEDYTIQNILNTDHSRGNSCAEGATNAGATRHGTAFDPLQQFAACCDLVSNIESSKNSSSFCAPHMRFSDIQREVQVAMQQSDLWWKFYACGTEMVITRTGRRMFPTLALSFLGMDPRRYYSIHVDIVPIDGYAYTFVNNMWQVNGLASEMHALPYIQSYQADEVAHTGLYWMKNGVDFKKVRLTNRRVGQFKDGELHLSPNRKYQPRIHVVEETEEGVKVSCSTYVFPETAFIAVTTYQNEELIQMKIDHNPFAKGFRDKGSRRRYVPYEQREDLPDSSQSSLSGFYFMDRTADSSHSRASTHLRLQNLKHF